MSIHGGRGYLMIDNRASGGKLMECATLTCVHCGTVVVLNPERKRQRGWCRKCNAYTCDQPGCQVDCNPIQQCVDLSFKYAETGQDFLGRTKEGHFPLFDPKLKEQEKLFGGATILVPGKEP